MLPCGPAESQSAKCYLCLQILLANCLCLVHSRGGGSKRTFGSPKSQNSPNQQSVDCGDQQQACNNEQSDPSWSSAFGATMALIGPLLVLLTLIIMIKFCFYKSDEKEDQQQQQQSRQRDQDGRQLHLDSSFTKFSPHNSSNHHHHHHHQRQRQDKQVAGTKETCCCVSIGGQIDNPRAQSH